MKFNIKNNLPKLFTVILGVCLTVNTSCNKFLDIRPVGEITGEQLLSNPEGFESALYGVYASMNSSSLYGRELSYDMIDVLAQYYVCPGNLIVENAKKYNYQYVDVEAKLNTIWGDMYKNIANVNNIIINLDKMNANSMRFYNLYKGEALGIRAFMHFDLLRLYTANIQNNENAEGLPYSVKFELSPSSFSSAAKVYEYIIADLLAAEDLLAKDVEYFTNPKVNPTEPFLRDRETHFNLYAVQATLARVYLNMGDKANAAKYAQKVVDSNKFKLMTANDFATDLQNGMLYPTETIFGLYNKTNYTLLRDRFWNYTTSYSYSPRPDLLDTYAFEEEPVDYRISTYFKDNMLGTGPVKRFIKLLDKYQFNEELQYARPANVIDGTNLIRLPEMHYILAESLLDSSPSTATAYFNAVLNSRGLTSLSNRNTPLTLTLERITNERYKEFIGEGQTFFNMKRLNLPIMNTDNVVVPASNQVYVWPIPLDEKEFNY